MNEKLLQAMTDWLKTCPMWEDTLFIDYTNGLPGSSGLFPAGVEELSRREDVLGNVKTQYRAHFDLLRVTTGQQDNTENAAWLISFQQWVRQQSAAGLAPKFGCEPAREHIRAENGKLKSASQTGTGTYTVHLSVDYTL